MTNKAQWYITRFAETSGGYAVISSPEAIYTMDGNSVALHIVGQGIKVTADSIDKAELSAARFVRDQLSDRFDYPGLVISVLVEHRLIIAEPDSGADELAPWPIFID